jgi:hypothetical protein
MLPKMGIELETDVSQPVHCSNVHISVLDIFDLDLCVHGQCVVQKSVMVGILRSCFLYFIVFTCGTLYLSGIFLEI